MKRLTPSCLIVVALAFLLPVFARAADGEITEAMVQQRLTKGQELAAGGFPAQALTEYLWCYDEGFPAVPRLRALRTTVLVGMIKRLARDNGDAEIALGKRCDEAEKRLLAGDEGAAMEFSALCDALGSEKRLLKVFDKIPAGDPRRHGFGLPGVTALLGKKRYADAASAMSFEAMLRVTQEQFAHVPPNAEEDDPRHDAAVTQALDFIEVLAGAKDQAHADEIIAKLKTFDASGTTKRDIEKRLKRAG
jgi:hypothetical protein